MSSRLDNKANTKLHLLMYSFIHTMDVFIHTGVGTLEIGINKTTLLLYMMYFTILYYYLLLWSVWIRSSSYGSGVSHRKPRWPIQWQNDFICYPLMYDGSHGRCYFRLRHWNFRFLLYTKSYFLFLILNKYIVMFFE